MRRQNGFTLIELVVVIVILGILAATAAPKFMDLQKDARISAANGLAGAIKSAISMTYSKAILAGKDKAATGATICNSGAASASCTGTDAVELAYGRPAATANGIINAIDIDAEAKPSGTTASTKEWNYNAVAATGGNPAGIGIWQVGSSEVSSATVGCGVYYEASASATTAPKVTVVTTDC